MANQIIDSIPKSSFLLLHPLTEYFTTNFQFGFFYHCAVTLHGSLVQDFCSDIIVNSFNISLMDNCVIYDFSAF